MQLTSLREATLGLYLLLSILFDRDCSPVRDSFLMEIAHL